MKRKKLILRRKIERLKKLGPDWKRRLKAEDLARELERIDLGEKLEKIKL